MRTVELLPPSPNTTQPHYRNSSNILETDLDQVVSKTTPNMALRYSNCPSLCRLATTKSVNSRRIASRPTSSRAAPSKIPDFQSVRPIIPRIQSTSQSDVPSAEILSKLSVFGLCHILTEPYRSNDELGADSARRSQVAWRQRRLGFQHERNDGGTDGQVPPGEGVLVVSTSREEYEEEGSGDGGAWYDAPTADRHGGCFKVGAFCAGGEYARGGDGDGVRIGDQEEIDDNTLVMKETPEMITHLPQCWHSFFDRNDNEGLTALSHMGNLWERCAI